MANTKIDCEMLLDGKKFREVKHFRNENQIFFVSQCRFINEDYYKETKVLNKSTKKILDENNETNIKCLEKLNSFQSEWRRRWQTFFQDNLLLEYYLNIAMKWVIIDKHDFDIFEINKNYLIAISFDSFVTFKEIWSK